MSESPQAQPQAATNSKLPVLIVSAVAAVVAIVAIVLAVSYRSQENSVTNQLRQVTNQLGRLEQAQQTAARTSQEASTARLGLCWSSSVDNSTFDVQSVQLASPVVAGGVYECPTGMTFVSVVPAAGS